MQEKEPTIGDVLEAVKDGFGLMDERFNSLEQRLDAKIDAVDSRLSQKIEGLTVAVDGFARNQITFDHELVANRAAHERFEERLTSIENRA